VGCLYDLRSPLAAHIQTLVRKEELAQNSGIGFLGNGRMTGHVAYLVHGWRHTSSRGSVPPICAHRDFFAFKRDADFCSVWRTCLRAFDVSFVALVGFHRATVHPSKEGAFRWTIRIATAVEHPTDVARRCWCRIHSLDIDVCRSVPEAARESLDRGAVASRSAAVERRMGLLPHRGVVGCAVAFIFESTTAGACLRSLEDALESWANCLRVDGTNCHGGKPSRALWF